jgi:dTDP-4-amino-4,6-dideoxygalactose transaminase
MILCANPSAQFESHRKEIEAAIAGVLRSNRYILGPEVEAFEREFAEFIGVGHGIGVANGTDALEIALRGLRIGVGDEVITVSHTAVATVAAIESAGAEAVLVDVEPRYYTMDAAQLETVVSERTRAVIVVHLYGQTADLGAISAFCRKHGLVLIEDASQAHGARWQGKRLGSIGRVACYSFYPTKNLGAIGDGGIVTTDDADLAKRMRMLREYGWQQRYTSEIPGRNSRLDELQAAILRVKLRHLDADNQLRRDIAAIYTAALCDTLLALPETRTDAEHAFHLYVVRTGNRKELVDRLKTHAIHPGIHYPVPVHCQPAYHGRVRTGASMKVTETLAAEVLSLPMYPELTGEEVAAVTKAVTEASQGCGAPI